MAVHARDGPWLAAEDPILPQAAMKPRLGDQGRSHTLSRRVFLASAHEPAEAALDRVPEPVADTVVNEPQWRVVAQVHLGPHRDWYDDGQLYLPGVALVLGFDGQQGGRLVEEARDLPQPVVDGGQHSA